MVFARSAQGMRWTRTPASYPPKPGHAGTLPDKARPTTPFGMKKKDRQGRSWLRQTGAHMLILLILLPLTDTPASSPVLFST